MNAETHTAPLPEKITKAENHYSPEQFESNLLELWRQVADHSIGSSGSWYTEFGGQLESLILSLQNIRQKYQAAMAAPAHINALLQALTQFRGAMENLEFPSRVDSQVSLVPGGLRKAFRQFNRTGQKLSFPLELSVLAPAEQENRRRRFRKAVSRFTSGFSLRRQKLKRFLLRRKNAEIGLTRCLIPGGLVKHYAWIPAETMLLEEWAYFNRASADAFKVLFDVFSDSVLPGEPPPENNLRPLSEIRETYENALKSVDSRFLKEHGRFRDICMTDWRLAGTFVLPGKKLNEKRYVKKHRKFGLRFIEYRSAWDKYWQGRQKDNIKDIDLMILIWKARQDFLKTKSEVRQWHLEFIENRVAAIKTKIESFRQTALAEGKTGDLLRRFIQSASTGSFIREIARDALVPVDALQTFKLSKMLIAYRETITKIVNELDDQYVVVRTSEKNQLIPQAELVPFSMKELIGFFTQSEFDRALVLLSDSARNDILSLSDELTTISEIVQGALDTAYMLLRKDQPGVLDGASKQTPLEVLLEGLDRTQDKLSFIITQVESLESSAFTQLSEKYLSFIDQVNSLREDSTLLQVRLSLMKARAQGRVRDFWKSLVRETVRGFTLARSSAVPHVRRAVHLGLKIYRIVTVKTRLQINATETVSVNVYLRKARSAIEGLPAVYQRLFNFSPLESDKFLVARKEELEELQATFENWRQGQTGMVALVGERGSGRSSLVNMALQGFLKDENVKHIQSKKTLTDFDDMRMFLENAYGMGHMESMGALEDKVNQLQKDQVIILEDFHRLFLKTAMGLRIFNRLLLFAARTQHITFWFITSGNYCWLYLDKVLELQRFFARVITLRGLTREEIEEVITVRHRISGIPLEFSETAEIKMSRKYNPLFRQSQRMELNRSRFFEYLHTHSDGNVSIAMILWLIAIENQDNRRFKLNEGFSTDPRMLSHLTAEELFVITAIIQHEVLSVDELSQLMNIPRDASLLVLTGLFNRHILEHKDGNYSLHFFLYRPMTRLLYEKRFIH